MNRIADIVRGLMRSRAKGKQLLRASWPGSWMICAAEACNGMGGNAHG